jgi:carbon monoxide dehydrogenase subunit G
MKIEGTQEVHASRDQVFALLTNREVLLRCIPGCQSLEEVGENAYAATMRAGVGAIKGNFKGNVRLEDMRNPEHYRIVVDAKGGPGFVKGAGDFDLEDKDGGTLIKYKGEMQVGGIIAGVGQRMIEAAAKMMAAKFFTALENETKNGSAESNGSKPESIVEKPDLAGLEEFADKSAT